MQNGLRWGGRQIHQHSTKSLMTIRHTSRPTPLVFAPRPQAHAWGRGSLKLCFEALQARAVHHDSSDDRCRVAVECAVREAELPECAFPSWSLGTSPVCPIRHLFSILAIVLPVLVCSTGCTPRTPAETAAATDKVLQEIGVAPSKVQSSEAVASSIPEEAPNALDGIATAADSKEKVAANSPTTNAIKPKTTVDDLNRSWLIDDELPRETWEVQYLGNATVGFLHRKCVASPTVGPGYNRQELTSRVRVSLKGKSLEQRMQINTLERGNGELVTIECKVEIGPSKQSYSGRVSQEQLILTGSENGQPFNVTIDFRKDCRGPFAVEQSMLRRPMQPKETRKLKYFDPIHRKVVDGRLEASDLIMTPTQMDGSKELLEVRNISIMGDKVAQSLLWVDKKGEGFKSLVQASDILAFRTKPNQAKLVESIFDLRALDLALIPLGGPVERLKQNEADRTSISYRVAHRVDDPYRMFTDRVGQRIKSNDPRSVEVTVYQNGRELDAALENGVAFKVEPAALAASPIIPVDLPQIQKLATGLIAMDKSLSPETASNSDKAFACQREIQKRIALREFDKQIGTVSDSLKAKEANCVEHACLFASVCRSLSIPTRIALGVKYNGSMEMPLMSFHAWIEIRDGARWVPVDSTDAAFPTSIDRIKIRESYFDTENLYAEVLSVYQLLSGLEIQVLP